ncbi:MAG: 8-oxo-dGTP diphosphatase [Solobacterium sp.]|nr:8-oxo-dGTP diphosphatase [Solobacterium sp.]
MKRSTCVYLQQDSFWLMLFRNKKQDDVNQGKWIGVGGKAEGNETYEACALREVKEETGLDVFDLTFRGFVDFHYDIKEPERIAIYTGTRFSGSLQETREGELAWIAEKDILSLPLWEGDRIFLKRLLNHEEAVFHLVLHYNNNDELLSVSEGETV